MISIHLNPKQKLALYADGGWPVLLVIFLFLRPMIYIWSGGNETFRSLQLAYKELSEAEGYITDITETNVNINEEDVYRYDYSFPVGLETVYGFSFSHRFDLDLDDKVIIEYLQSDPGISRIRGANRSNTAALSFIGIALLLAGIIGIPLRIRRLQRMLRILADGTIARADFVRRKRTNVSINDKSQFKLTYVYRVGNFNNEISLRTTDSTGMNRAVNVLYSNQNPREALLIPQLPYMVYRKVMDAKGHEEEDQ